LVFFPVHFCGFHAGHSVFLNIFFPLKGLPQDGFGRAFMNPPLLLAMAARHLLKPYGLFIIPALLAERHNIIIPLNKVLSGKLEAESAAINSPNPVQRRYLRGGFAGEAMFRPYANVIRMHLLIFFFAFSSALKFDSFYVYSAIYLSYFFPWNEVKIIRNKRSNKRREQFVKTAS
jgi:hypothetical protein